jgi:hypothetical protein
MRKAMGTRTRRIRLALVAALALVIVAAACPVWPYWRPRDGRWTRDKEWVPLWEAAAHIVREDARDLHYYVELAVRVGVLLSFAGWVAGALWPVGRRDRQDAAHDFQDREGGRVPDGRADHPTG